MSIPWFDYARVFFCLNIENFSIAYMSNPILSSSTPSDDVTNVGIGSDIILNFSEAVAVDSGHITIFSVDNKEI